MRLLLDTVTFLWFVQGSSQLSATAKAALVEPSNEAFVSAVSAWEIAVKNALGRLPLPERPAKWVPAQREAHAFDSLPLDELAALSLGKLPHIHRDPFDRMLVAQSLAHGLTLVTPDETLHQYPAPTLW